MDPGSRSQALAWPGRRLLGFNFSNSHEKLHVRDPAARIAPEFCCEVLPSENQRAYGTSGARCTRSLVCENKTNTRANSPQIHRFARRSVRNGFNGFLRALLGDRAFLPPSPTNYSAGLTPASGRQDHTTPPSASSAFVKGAIRVHRIPPRVRDDRASAPSVGRDGGRYRPDLGLRKIRIFLQKGLDTGGDKLPR
jgi:hypothetical protein